MSTGHRGLREEVVRIAPPVARLGPLDRDLGERQREHGRRGRPITPSGLDYALLGPEDVVLVDARGKVLEGRFEPYSEWPMHAGIYRSRPGVGGIVHTHAPYSTTLACLGWGIPPVHHMLVALSEEGRVPIIPYATYGTEALARLAAEALGDSHHACLLQNHGTITVGETASVACSRAGTLEEMAGLCYRAMLAGEPVLLTPEQIKQASRKMATYGRPLPLKRVGKAS